MQITIGLGLFSEMEEKLYLVHFAGQMTYESDSIQAFIFIRGVLILVVAYRLGLGLPIIVFSIIVRGIVYGW